MFNTIETVHDALCAQHYIPSDEIATTMFLADRLGKPLLTEGPAGVAKPNWRKPGLVRPAMSLSVCNVMKDWTKPKPCMSGNMPSNCSIPSCCAINSPIC